MRGKFTAPGTSIHYYVVEFDPTKLSRAPHAPNVLGRGAGRRCRRAGRLPGAALWTRAPPERGCCGALVPAHVSDAAGFGGAGGRTSAAPCSAPPTPRTRRRARSAASSRGTGRSSASRRRATAATTRCTPRPRLTPTRTRTRARARARARARTRTRTRTRTLSRRLPPRGRLQRLRRLCSASRDALHASDAPVCGRRCDAASGGRAARAAARPGDMWRCVER